MIHPKTTAIAASNTTQNQLAQQAMSNCKDSERSIQQWQLELLDDDVHFKKLLSKTTNLYSDVSAIVTEYLLPFTVNNDLLSPIVPSWIFELSHLRDDELGGFVSVYSIQRSFDQPIFETWEIVAQSGTSPNKYMIWQADVYDHAREICIREVNGFPTLESAYKSLDICSQSSFQVCQSAIETTGKIIVADKVSLADRLKRLEFALKRRK